MLAKTGNPQQPLLQRDAAVTEAALRATEACIENDPDALAKSKKRIDETVLPPLLRALLNCFLLLKDELGKIKQGGGADRTYLRRRVGEGHQADGRKDAQGDRRGRAPGAGR